VERILRRAAVVCAVLVLCAPVAAIATISLTPLWSWLERTTGNESVWPSGPSGWCFLVIYGACIVAALSLVAYYGWRQPRYSEPRSAGPKGGPGS
jgi:hypothetical protein